MRTSNRAFADAAANSNISDNLRNIAPSLSTSCTALTTGGPDHDCFRSRYSRRSGRYSTVGCTQNTPRYANIGAVKTNSHEMSGAYVPRMPLRNITPFILPGVSATVFDRKVIQGCRHASPQCTRLRRHRLKLDERFSARAEYRGFVTTL